jgi:hypothetical protein
MEEMRTLNVIESLIGMILAPAIPVVIVGLTWLMTFGGFDLLLVVRSIPMIGIGWYVEFVRSDCRIK